MLKLSFDDLGECAVVNHILNASISDRRLSSISEIEEFIKWRPNGNPVWYEIIKNYNYDKWEEHNFFIIRQSVKLEKPAKYYIEDGSGRAMALYQKFKINNNCDLKIKCYLGKNACSSQFMKEKYPELL